MRKLVVWVLLIECFQRRPLVMGAELGFRTAESDVPLGYLWFQWALRLGGLWAEVQSDGHQEGSIIKAITNGSSV